MVILTSNTVLIAFLILRFIHDHAGPTYIAPNGAAARARIESQTILYTTTRPMLCVTEEERNGNGVADVVL